MSNFHLITRPKRDAIMMARLLREKGQAVLINPLLEIDFFLDELREFINNKNLGNICFIMTSINSLRALKGLRELNFIDLIISSDLGFQEARKLGFRSILQVGNRASDLKGFFQTNYTPQKEYIYLCGENITIDINETLLAQGFTSSKIIVYKAKRLFLKTNILERFKNNLISSISFFSYRTAEIFIEEIRKNGLESNLDLVTIFTISQKIANLFAKEIPLVRTLISEDYNHQSIVNIILEKGNFGNQD